MNPNASNTAVAYLTLCSDLAPREVLSLFVAARRSKPNGTSQAKRRREIRRRSNLPKAIQKRLGFKCH